MTGESIGIPSLSTASHFLDNMETIWLDPGYQPCSRVVYHFRNYETMNYNDGY